MNREISLSAPVREWIEHNLRAGASRPALIETMVAGGSDHGFAAAAVAQVQAGNLKALDIRGGSHIATTDGSMPVVMRVDSPPIAVLADVMSRQECEALIALARPRLKVSTVIDPATGQDVVASYRGSEGMFFRLGETPLIARLDRRFSEIMGEPLDHGEGLQVLRYGVGGESAPHFDFLDDHSESTRASLVRSGQRIATLIVYLNDVEAGGATVFPVPGLAIQPHRGHALHFGYRDLDGHYDRRSLHGGAPVEAGEKWVVTKWMRERRFVPRVG